MTFELRPLNPRFGVEVMGADISGALSDSEYGEILDAFETYSVLLFRGPLPDEDAHLAFSRRFGEVQVSFSGNQSGATLFSRQSNIDMKTGELMAPDNSQMRYQKGNMLWHSDSSYRPNGAKASILVAHETPPTGGNTEFVSLRVAWDDLSEDDKTLCRTLSAEHSLGY
ncbi:MAG: alpha-ketoglutarate-dependent 2,4-dichlorophenoxyacetate dioxygenase [Alphaproteobacteria bacterium]|jgi:alpha-ketoglutarate-dependent 2,4-dichlorophenoxyacetate dioxygenase